MDENRFSRRDILRLCASGLVAAAVPWKWADPCPRVGAMISDGPFRESPKREVWVKGEPSAGDPSGVDAVLRFDTTVTLHEVMIATPKGTAKQTVSPLTISGDGTLNVAWSKVDQIGQASRV